MFEVGRVCLKTAGREAGRYCVILKKMDEKFVMITGPGMSVKRRRCNIQHLEPILEKLKIKAEATDEEVLKAFESEGLFSKLNITKAKFEPKAEHKEAKKEEHKAEHKEEKAEHKVEHKEEKKAEHIEKEAKAEKKPKKAPAKKTEKPKAEEKKE